MTVHNLLNLCAMQHRTVLIISLLASRQTSQLRCCLKHGLLQWLLSFLKSCI